MTRWRSPGGHRRTVKSMQGDPRRVRDLKMNRAADKDSCRFPDPRCTCLACDPETGS